MISRYKTLSSLLVVVACLVAAGCGGGVKRVTVTGKIVEGGAPLNLTGRDYQEGAASVEVRFYPADEALSNLVASLPISLSTTAKLDGTFVIDGGDGKGIPVGKYKVVLTNRNSMVDRTRPQAGSAQGDAWGGRFSQEKTPFTFDIQQAQEVVLDVKASEAKS